jgi:murein DD-endopeptidase MepM/ murein hydrolase activator NlpD
MNVFEGYRITSKYGYRSDPIDGTRKFHAGIDLAKKHQDPIYAFTEGEVLHAGEGKKGSGFGGFGNVVAILDDKGALHSYCHLSYVLVKVGQKVEKGDLVGRQGATGRVTGSHLHYEIRKKSSPSFGWSSDSENFCYDPTKYLIDYYTPEEPEAYQMNGNDGEKIIGLLSAYWFLVSFPDAREEVHRLANEVRKCAGIPLK